MSTTPWLRGSRQIELLSVFSPLSMTVFLYTPLLLLYAVTDRSVFAGEFTSRKALGWSGMAYFGLALTCFAVGAVYAQRKWRSTPRRSYDEQLTLASKRRSIAVILEGALLLSIAAYAVWFGIGVWRAGGPAQFIHIWRTDPFHLKIGILATQPGITTLVQLAVACVPLAFALGFVRRGSVLRALVFVAIGLGVLRAFFFSERLALVELLVPLLFLLLAPRRFTIPRIVLYAVVLLTALMLFFAASELRRTYVYTGNASASQVTTRFFGYYLTSVNNGMAVIEHYPAATPFYWSGQFYWLFPGVRDLRLDEVPALGTVSLRYADAFNVDPASFWPQAFADQGLNYEFNVFTAPGFLAADYGWLGLLAVFLLGVISGRLYLMVKASRFHRALYSVWLVGLFEFMRILYFTNTRTFPVYLVFFAVYLALRVPVRHNVRALRGRADTAYG